MLALSNESFNFECMYHRPYDVVLIKSTSRRRLTSVSRFVVAGNSGNGGVAWVSIVGCKIHLTGLRAVFFKRINHDHQP